MTVAVKELVSLGSRVLGAAGHGDLIWGHASVRDPEGRGAWLKRAGIGLEEVTFSDVQLVSPNGAVLEGDGARHSEFPIHTEILEARPDVGGVVHTHSRYAVALAAAGHQLLPVSHEANYFVPPLVPRFTETGDLVKTPKLGRHLAAVLGGQSAVFLVNHGIVTVGADLQEAVVAALLLDRACRQQLLTITVGGNASWSDEAESLSKRRNIYSSMAVHDVWDYLVRSL